MQGEQTSVIIIILGGFFKVYLWGALNFSYYCCNKVIKYYKLENTDYTKII